MIPFALSSPMTGGFDLRANARQGAGFVNMSDRLGALGGELQVDSEPGVGTRISGRIPLG